MHTPTKPRYRAFLLRLWEEDALKPPAEAWRFSLEDPHSGQKRGFASLAALVTFLEQEMSSEAVVRVDPAP